MKVVIYACVPVQASNGLFRRVRIVIDGMKVTSIDSVPGHWDHDSCNHKPTQHRYSRYESLLVAPALRLRPNGVVCKPPRCVEE